MNVASLDILLHRLADLMDAADSARGASEIRTLANNLAPFGNLAFSDFSTFLVKAEAFSRGELESVFPKPKAKPVPKLKAPKELIDPDIVAKTIAQLRTLYDRALDSGFNELHVDETLSRADSLKAPQLKEVVKGCGFHQTFKSKQASIDAIRKWILGRKGTHERAGA